MDQQNLPYDATPARTEYVETANNVHLHLQDYGSGKPVILIHGWPMSLELWEYQISSLVAGGFRVIAYDRRGFGKSSKPWDGYDYDTLTEDLNAIIETLKLTDITLIGFSMGGGEVARYFSKFGGRGVTKAILVSSVLPFMLKTEDNPEGAPKEMFDEMAAQIQNDRIGFLDDFGKSFFGVGLLSKPLSTPLLDYYRMLCSVASPRATLKCAESFSSTDFRKDLATIHVPTLIIHGNADKTVPIAISSDKSSKMIANSRYIVYEGAPHGLFYTEKERLNKDLLDFLNS